MATEVHLIGVFNFGSRSSHHLTFTGMRSGNGATYMAAP